MWLNRRFVVASLCLMVVTMIVLALLRLQRDRVTESDYDRIEFGMTKMEVENLIGLEPGSYSADKGAFVDAIRSEGKYANRKWGGLTCNDGSIAVWNENSEELDRNKGYYWAADRFQITIILDDDGRVVHKELHEMVTLEQSFLGRIMSYFSR